MSCEKLTTEGNCKDSKGSEKLPRCIDVPLSKCGYESAEEKAESEKKANI